MMPSTSAQAAIGILIVLVAMALVSFWREVVVMVALLIGLVIFVYACYWLGHLFVVLAEFRV